MGGEIGDKTYLKSSETQGSFDAVLRTLLDTSNPVTQMTLIQRLLRTKRKVDSGGVIGKKS
jgi:hypothetical protein